MDTNFGTLFDEFLEFREWKDDNVEFDAEKEKYSIATTVGVNGQPFKLFMDGHQDTSTLGIFFYFNFNVSDSQHGEMALLLNWINQIMLVGHFECAGEHVRWVQKFDCEGTALSAITVSINVQHGWNYVERFMEPIASVALTRTAAEAAIEKYQVDLHSTEDDNVPDEV